MKNYLKLALVTIALVNCGSIIAQNAEPTEQSSSPLSKLSLSPTVGVLNSWGDLSTAGRFAEFGDPAQNRLGYGLRVNYDFLRFLRVSGGVIAGSLTDTHNEIKTTGAVNEPSDLGLGIFYETSSLEIIFPRVDINLTRLIFQNRSNFFNHFSANLHADHGLIFFNSKIYASQDPDVHLLYGRHRGRSGETKETVSSVGLDLSYRISDQFDINLGTSYRNVWNDRLDAWESPGSSNDKITYTSLGLTFYLGKRAKPTVSRKSTSKKDEESFEETRPQPEKDSSYAVLKNPVVEEPESKEPVEDTTSASEVEPKEEPVVETQKDSVETAPKKDDSDKAESLENGPGNYVIVSAFKTRKVAEISAERFEEKGETPVVVHDKKRGYYLVSIARYDDLDEALQVMRQARTKGYKLSWVYIKID